MEKRARKRDRGSSGVSSSERARKARRGHPGFAYFEQKMLPVLKQLNKLYNFPSWAMNPKHAEIDRSLMLRKVQGYLVEIGDHLTRTFDVGRRAEAWEYVAEKAETKLRGPVLRRLYDDIVAQSGEQGDQPVAEVSKDHEEKDSSSGRKSEGSTKGSR